MENNSETAKEVSEASQQETVELQDVQTPSTQTQDSPDAEPSEEPQSDQEQKKRQLAFVEGKKSESSLGKAAVEGAESAEIKKSKSTLERQRSSTIDEEEGDAALPIERLKSEELRRSKLWSKTQLTVGSVISIGGQSTDRVVLERRGPRYMNTYKLWSDNPFNPEKVQKILEIVMTDTFDELTYNPELCANKAKFASASIRQRVKELEFDRYKIVCLVTIGERNSQDILVTARGLWDLERDRYAFFTIENNQLFGIAQCYGLYYE